MTTPKILSARPSQESLRKQAKSLARDQSLSLRDAQLALARLYGYAGWQDLSAEVLKRLGRGVEWAGDQAERAIHDNDLDRLKQLLSEYPALLSWGLEHGGLVGRAVHAYGDAFDPRRELIFTRRECAKFLIDAGAVVVPWLADNILNSRAKGLLQLFDARGLLPRTLKFFVALGDERGVRAAFDDPAQLPTQDVVNEAFMTACAFQHETIAQFLAEHAFTPPLETSFVEYMCRHSVRMPGVTPKQAFVLHRLKRAVDAGDLQEFERLIDLRFAVELIGHAVLANRPELIERLFELDPGLLQRRPPPPSSALSWALIYGKAHLVPLLTRVWPLPDDLTHAAGVGDLAGVKKWFDEAGAPALGDPTRHFPDHKARVGSELHWSPPTVQRALDTAFAWAVMNNHFAVADFLLQHGADVNTRWGSHEPASILHELVFQNNYPAMQFLIDRGIDMTLIDYRWNATAQGWAHHAANDEKMAQWLAEAERRRNSSPESLPKP